MICCGSGDGRAGVELDDLNSIILLYTDLLQNLYHTFGVTMTLSTPAKTTPNL